MRSEMVRRKNYEGVGGGEFQQRDDIFQHKIHCLEFIAFLSIQKTRNFIKIYSRLDLKFKNSDSVTSYHIHIEINSTD
jgi:hypothetical protein